MPPNSTATREAILNSAKKEFLEKGYANAHLRTIATNAGLTTGALYRHYEGKTALFNTLVDPVRTQLIHMFTGQTDEFIADLETKGMEPMWERQNRFPDDFVDFVYENMDEMKLLLSYSVGDDLIHTLIQLEVDLTLRYLNEARKRGFPVYVPDPIELHMIASSQFITFFELVLHDIPKEKGYHYAKTMVDFYTAGWKEIILHYPPN